MTEKIEKSTGELIQLVDFRIGNEEYGVDVSLVREITRVADISRIPEAPSFIRGVTNLGGQILAVIDLAGQFGLGSRDKLPESARIMVTEVRGQTVGMLVDEVPEVLKIPEENIEPAPELLRARLGKDYIKGIGRVGNRLIMLLDLEKVLAIQEVEEVARVGTLETKE